MTLAPLHGGYEEGELQYILDSACTAVGLDAAGAQLLRGHTNAVVRLSTSPVVVKVARRGTKPEAVQRTVDFVRWLMESGFPTVALHPVRQPVVVARQSVTFWAYLPQLDRPVAASQIAKPLCILHTLPTPPVQLPRHDNVAAIRASIDAITSLPTAMMQFLTEQVDRLAAELTEVEFRLPESVIQGDPQHRNALHDGGTAVLCDWDTVGVGHPEWDLVTIEIHCRRFGYGRSHYQEFADTYGFDVCDWPGFRTLRDIRELRMITTNARKAAHNPGTLEEVERRINGLRQGDIALPWRIL
ncbi:phosphotransferase [Streptomyces varsoviensis]|uniref:phosphotransferase n=1 Tax=Streptomyces varsoviensis TaxID=67373 RepID=UPI0004CAC4E1|nr:phosphotransferase [Streptomyces varsoviensis]